MQCKESVQGNTRDQVVTADPQRQIIANDRNGAKQVYDHLRTPVGHLTPGQQITHECFGHQNQVNQHTEDPDQLARPDTGHELIHQHQHRQRTKEVPHVEVLGRVILANVLVPRIDNWKTFVYPVH